jgi:CheY-like chemotaxis protein
MTQVVLIEKSPAVRSEVRTCLEAEGHRVTDVADGIEALKVLREHYWPQVVLVGHLTPRLPLIAFLGVAREAADLRQHVFIVLGRRRRDVPANIRRALCDDLRAFVVDCPRAGCRDPYTLYAFLETLTEACRCAEAV